MVNFLKNKKIILFIILILLLVEITSRVFYYLKYGNTGYLIAPFCSQTTFHAINMDYIVADDGKILYYKFNHGINTIKAYYDDKEYTNTYYINKNGFRNREIKLIKDRYRIICLGGSTLASLDSPDDQTIPVFLEQFLSKYNIEVINMGIDGYTSSEVLELYTREAYKYNPDTIIAYFGRNDIYRNNAILLNNWYNWLFYQIHKVFYQKSIAYTIFIERTRMFIEEYLALHVKEKKFLSCEYNPSKKFLENFKSIVDFSKKHNIKVIYICEVPNYKGDAHSHLNLLKRNSNNSLGNQSITDVEEVCLINVFKLQEDIKNICKERSLQFIDGRAEFYEKMLNSRQDFFLNNNSDKTHLTPKGNEVMAEIISKQIIP
jgi:lysophospholipase L1-like esterase